MRMKLIAALAAGGSLLGMQGSALAQNRVPYTPRAPAHERALYNYYPRCNGTFDPYSDTCYPAGFQGPWH